MDCYVNAKEFKVEVDVSVIIPVYNSDNTINRTVESVVLQTVRPKEIIIVDDFSSSENIRDILVEIRKKYIDRIKIKLLFLEKNVGAGSARNAGWEIATGKYIAFLDSDDVWHPQKLEIQYNFMIQNQEIFLSTHGMTVINDKTKSEYFNKDYISCEQEVIQMNPKRLLFKHYSDGTPCVMIKNNVRYRFLEGKRYSEDYLLWLEILFENKGAFINKNLSAAFKNLYGAGGLSANLLALEKGELETFAVLRGKGYISGFLFVLCKSFSLIKYFRRVMICYLRSI